ncbi:unnamed protein product [Allacma fusca]|uniref:Uncharacterized protein n=1 Tax=Allacma fusca TaxID=39272 RepID=A0A8J2L0T2_9HEXA|nr:unnamed protein product [Allacma fusca]
MYCSRGVRPSTDSTAVTYITRKINQFKRIGDEALFTIYDRMRLQYCLRAEFIDPEIFANLSLHIHFTNSVSKGSQ